MGSGCSVAPCLALLAARGELRWARTSGWVYAVVTVAALSVETFAVWRGALPGKKAENRAYEYNVGAYVRTGDFAHLHGQLIPFPSDEWLRNQVLNVPKLRALLPASVREPIRLTGLDSTDAQLPGRRVRAVPNGSRWESPPLPIGRGWWVFETSGDLGKPGTSLLVVTRDGGRVLGRIVPSKVPGSSWRAAYIRAPRVPARLVAQTSASTFFAVSDPVEMSSCSYVAWRVSQHGTWLAWAGACGLTAAIVGGSRRRVGTPSHEPLGRRSHDREMARS